MSCYAKPLNLKIFICKNHLRSFSIAMFFSLSNVKKVSLVAYHCSQYRTYCTTTLNERRYEWKYIIRTLEKYTNLHNLKNQFHIHFSNVFRLNFKPKLLHHSQSSKHFSKKTISSFSLDKQVFTNFIYFINWLFPDIQWSGIRCSNVPLFAKKKWKHKYF